MEYGFTADYYVCVCKASAAGFAAGRRVAVEIPGAAVPVSRRGRDLDDYRDGHDCFHALMKRPDGAPIWPQAWLRW